MIIREGKTNVKYLFIVVILAIIAGGIMFTAIGSIKCPYWWPSQQQVPLTKDETAGWQTYRNEKMGFEIKYPKDFTVSNEEVLSTATRVDFLKKGEGGGENVLFSAWTGVHYSQELGRVYTMEEWIELNFPSLREGESKNNIKFGLGNYDGIRVDKYKEVGVIKLIPYVFAKDPDSINTWEFMGNIPTISTDLPTDYDVYKIFNQMLSTFRFLE